MFLRYAVSSSERSNNRYYYAHGSRRLFAAHIHYHYSPRADATSRALLRFIA